MSSLTGSTPSTRHLPTQVREQVFWRDAALPFVDSRRACHSRACYRPHHHPTFSIGAVDAGLSLFTGAAEGPVVLTPGTLVFVPPARVHACNPVIDSAWSYQMLHLDAAWRHAMRQEYGKPALRRHGPPAAPQIAASATAPSPHALPPPQPGARDHGAAEPVRIVQDPALYAQFCQLNDLLFSDAARPDKEAALIAFIGDCDHAHGLCIHTPKADPALAARIQPALDWLTRTDDSPCSLDALARQVALSRYQLIRAFRAVTGMTPHAWQLSQRINLARACLQRGERIAAVAHQLGFADQAHFQRVFKAHTGVTPGRFKA